MQAALPLSPCRDASADHSRSEMHNETLQTLASNAAGSLFDGQRTITG
jgi:hypothetical protein